MSRPTRWNWLLVLPLLMSLVVCWDVLATMAARVSYPYDLEWMEGGVLAHAWRAMHGKSIYPDPGPDFLPMVYTPGYYWVLAALGRVFGLGYTLGRLVSIAGTLSACAAILWGTHRWIQRAPLGLVGVAVFMGAYESSGAFYDLVRPDALAMGLLAWTIVLAPDPKASRQIGAALLLFLAFLVKHNCAAFGMPIVLGLWAIHGWRSALRFGLIAAVPAGLFTLAMQGETHGNFLTYIVSVPASHPIVWNRALPGAVRELGHAMPAACVVLSIWMLVAGVRASRGVPAAVMVVLPTLGAIVSMYELSQMGPVEGLMAFPEWQQTTAYAWLGVLAVGVPLTLIVAVPSRRLDGAWVYGAGVFVTAVVIAFMMRAHHGGFINVFIPLHWMMAFGMVAATADILELLPTGRSAPLAAVVAIAQPIETWSDSDLARLVPTKADADSGDRLVAYLKTIEGPVLSPYAPWLPVLAGHDPHFHLISLWDIDHRDGPYTDAADLIDQSIAKHRWAAIVDAERTMGHGVRIAYHEGEHFHFGNTFMPRTGWRQRPSVVWLPGKDDRTVPVGGDPNVGGDEGQEPSP